MNEELSENEMLDNFAHQQTLKPEKPLPKSAPEKGSPKVKETKPPEKKWNSSKLILFAKPDAKNLVMFTETTRMTHACSWTKPRDITTTKAQALPQRRRPKPRPRSKH